MDDIDSGVVEDPVSDRVSDALVSLALESSDVVIEASLEDVWLPESPPSVAKYPLGGEPDV